MTGGGYVKIGGDEWTNDKTKLQHTYREFNKEYKITIKGKIKWVGNSATKYIPNNTRYTITSIELPTNNSSIQFITDYGFYNFKELQSIPKGLFDKCMKVTSFDGCFSGCNKLQSIPKGLFDNNTLVTNFSYCFNFCSSLQSIPEGLFDKCMKVTGFEDCFFNCSRLQSIPKGLFDNNILVTIFNDCFCGCSSLQSIPKGLFDNNTLVTDFSGCFSDCWFLKLIPETLFDKCINVTNFNYCFYDCNSVTSKLPELWITHPNAKHSVCFDYCNKAPNYADAYAAGWATYPAISLTIETTKDNTIVNLSQFLNPLEDNKEIEISWGDGVTESISIDNVEHNYENVGEYIVDIEGDVEWVTPRLRMINNDWRIVEVRLKEQNQ